MQGSRPQTIAWSNAHDTCRTTAHSHGAMRTPRAEQSNTFARSSAEKQKEHGQGEDGMMRQGGDQPGGERRLLLLLSVFTGRRLRPAQNIFEVQGETRRTTAAGGYQNKICILQQICGPQDNGCGMISEKDMYFTTDVRVNSALTTVIFMYIGSVN